MSLSPKDRAKAQAWFDALKEDKRVFVLTENVTSSVGQYRDRRREVFWYEKESPLLAGTRFVLKYDAPDKDLSGDHFQRVLDKADTLADVTLRTHVSVRQVGRRAELRWLRVIGPKLAVQEFIFDADKDWIKEATKKERQYALAERDLAHAFIRHLSQTPVMDVAALDAIAAPDWQRVVNNLYTEGKLSLADIQQAVYAPCSEEE